MAQMTPYPPPSLALDFSYLPSFLEPFPHLRLHHESLCEIPAALMLRLLCLELSSHFSVLPALISPLKAFPPM